MPHCDIGPVTRLLAPGALPLRFTAEVYCHHLQPASCDNQLLDFFTRVNLAKLELTQSGFVNCQGPLDLIADVHRLVEPLSTLRELALGAFGWDRDLIEVIEWNQIGSGPHLDTLYVLESAVLLSELRQMIKSYTPKVIVIWSCLVQEGTKILDGSDIKLALSDICSVVRVTSEGLRPTFDWI